ncbi:hypothetical protein C8J56DRAFT_954563 [Mycena floridula]|nr:hypothetical protein C8J56DRAFT_954563 [Mycena floridula]
MSAIGSPSRPKPSLWKGRSKEVDDYVDYAIPRITYRHLLSQTLGVRDPFRVISLCDSDAFYASCEMVRLGIFDKPLVVLQWDSLIAVNYPARKFGISRMDKVQAAKERCPELIVVHVATYKEGQEEPGYWEDIDSRTHKVSLDYYRRESGKILAVFKECLVGAEIEKASIDEAFVDLTRPVRQILLQRYPYLGQLPDDAPKGLDTPLPPPPPISLKKTDTWIPIDPEKEEKEESDETELTWHDVALSIGAELMQNVREQVQSKLGYTTSAGIAKNKFLAKLTASYRKPNSQSILRDAAIPGYLKPMAFQKIRFLGGKLGDAIANAYDVQTVGDLLNVSLGEMQTKFGEDAIWVYEVLRGVDRAEVKEKAIVNKSMLASKNLPTPITRASEGPHWIRVLAAELTLRLNEARKDNPNLWPKTLVLHARKSYDSQRSKQSPFPFVRNVNVDVIAAAGDKLWKELVGPSTTILTVNNISLSFTGIEAMEIGQRSIDGFFRTGSVSKRHRDDDPIAKAEDQTESSHSFSCSRCGRIISLPPTMDPNEAVQAMLTLKQEHDDFHFAQDLDKDPSGSEISITSSRPVKKRRKASPKGIEKFFNRK